MSGAPPLPDLPVDWVWLTLGDLLEQIEAGKNFKCIERPPNPEETGVVKISAVTWGTYDEEESKTCPSEAFLDHRMLVRPGDLLFTRANTLQLVGACVVVGQVSKRLMLSDKVLRLGVPEEWRKWVLFVLRSPWGRSEIEHLATGNQLSMRNIGQDRIRAIRLPIPPLAECARIVAATEEQFSRLDAAVAGLERVRANLKRYRAAVLQAACEGRLVPTEAELARAEGRPYESGETLLTGTLVAAKGVADANKTKTARGGPGAAHRTSEGDQSSPTEMADRPFLPEGWCWATVEQVGRVQLGRQRSPKDHVGEHMRPYLRVANVYEARLDLHDVMEMNFTPTEFETYRLRPGDILLNEGQSLEWVGRAAMYRGELPGACFQNTLVRFQASEALLPEYALCVFRAYLNTGKFQRIARWTVNIAHLGAGRLAALDFPLPPLAEQARIVAELERRLSVIEYMRMNLDRALQRAAQLRQAILKRAFEGKLVPQDPTDEPASILLDRIHGAGGTEIVDFVTPRTKRAGGKSRRAVFPARGLHRNLDGAGPGHQ